MILFHVTFRHGRATGGAFETVDEANDVARGFQRRCMPCFVEAKESTEEQAETLLARNGCRRIRFQPAALENHR